MEVDDAVNLPPPAKETAEESPTPPPPPPPSAATGAAENGRSASRQSSRRHVPTPKALALAEAEDHPLEQSPLPEVLKSVKVKHEKKDKLKHEKTDKVNSEYAERQEKDDEQNSSLATPLKLQVSDDDDDEDGEQDEKMIVDVDEAQLEELDAEQPRKSRRAVASARRQLLPSRETEEEEGEENINEDDDAEAAETQSGSGGGGVSLKRKRYEVRRSGSEECLLGFDEKSGEAELVKNDEDAMLTPPATTTTDKVKEECENKTMLTSPTASPLVAKKFKKNPTAKSTMPKASIPSPAKSPQANVVKVEVEEEEAAVPSSLKNEEENKPTPLSPPISQPQELSPPQPKQHIVGDNEETNGGTTSTNKTPEASVVPSAAQPATPVPQPVKKPLSAQDDFYKKPFEYGWKRELVWRANMETSKDKADVYFITPAGKKLRTRSEIAPLLDGELTLEHFSFAREPLGVAPELELVRSAKASTRVSVTAATLAAAATPTNIGKRISKPKGPKGASPPPQGWTPTRALKVNNAALLSSASSSRYGGGFGGGANVSMPPSSRSSSGGGSSGPSGSKNSKAKKATVSSVTNVDHSGGAGGSSSGGGHEPCTTMCPRAPGQVPQLQCIKCLCLFHSECVGLSRLNSTEHRRRTGYICEACLPSAEQADKAAAAAATAIERQKPPPPTVAPAARAAVRAENKFPQTIAVVKGKKYVMVSKPIATTTAPAKHANDIENDLKQINESMRNSRKPSLISIDSVVQSHTQTAASAPAAGAGAAVEHSNKLFATNFFANVSFAYDALLCILKYLKIHERPRAASVCKLWHLAAKDTSLWHTVRMKNSKVCNWAGFTAALRRGETKQLDLRKMLLASTRSDEMWQDFAVHIGTVCSLEVIDLCRCSARVVEGLFQSNKQLRVLNAVAINDDTINLEHIDLLTGLEELRLRTCEPAVLAGDLHPLQSLSGLAHLSLTSIRGLGAKTVSVLGELTALRSLELGECGDFDVIFAETVLPRLLQLQRLRLENGQETGCCTLAILDAAAQLQQLSQLELVNFDIKPGFDEKLRQCINIRKLLIIPTYISQSATTNHIVLSAVQQVAETLQVFTWGVTVELLRVTALYVDQCEESTKKEKHHFDECIPVLKPVPGAPPADEDEDDDDDAGEKKTTKPIVPPPTPSSDELNTTSEVPQIEILPLDKVEFILGENLPQTKFTIVKVPYHATCKQQLVE